MEEDKKTVVEKIVSLFDKKTEKKDETVVEETTEVIEAAEETTEAATDEEVDEAIITLESISEQMIAIAETVASIDERLKTLEGDEAPAEEDAPAEDEEMSADIQKFGVIAEVNKWEITVDQDSFEVGTELTGTYEDGTTWKVSDGQYELEDGRTIHVDADGVIVLIEGEETTEDETPAEETEESTDDTEMSAEEVIVEDTEITELKSQIAELTKQVTELGEEDATQVILNQELEDSKSTNVALKAQIERQRKAIGKK